MSERIVINTGPLVALTRADALGILADLPFDFFCPREVEDELKAGAAYGHPFQWPSAVRVVALQKPLNPVARLTLDSGEAAVIQLASEQGVEWVCMDERKGRRAATAVGLRVVGTLGLLAKAKTLGVVPRIQPLIEGLMEHGIWYDRELVERVLRAVGE